MLKFYKAKGPTGSNLLDNTVAVATSPKEPTIFGIDNWEEIEFCGPIEGFRFISNTSSIRSLVAIDTLILEIHFIVGLRLEFPMWHENDARILLRYLLQTTAQYPIEAEEVLVGIHPHPIFEIQYLSRSI